MKEDRDYSKSIQTSSLDDKYLNSELSHNTLLEQKDIFNDSKDLEESLQKNDIFIKCLDTQDKTFIEKNLGTQKVKSLVSDMFQEDQNVEVTKFNQDIRRRGQSKALYLKQEKVLKEYSTVDANQSAINASKNIPKRRLKYSRVNKYYKLFEFSQVPDYLQDNQFILGSYRANYTFWDTLKSLFSLHNETGNVWTHLIGFLLFAGLTVYLATSPPTPVAINQQNANSLWVRAQNQLYSVRASVVSNLGSIQYDIQTVQNTLQSNYIQVREFGGSQMDHMSQVSLNLYSQLEEIQIQIKEYFTKGPDFSIQTKLLQRLTNMYNNFLLYKDSAFGNTQLDQQVHKQLLHSFQKIRSSDNLLQLDNYSLSELDQSLKRQFKQLFNWPTSRWPFYLYLAGAMICMFQSSFSHLAYVVSRRWSKLLWKLDYSGIIVITLTSFLAPVYYGFLCETFYQYLYMGVTVTLGTCVLSLSLLDSMQTTFPQWFRGGMFLVLGVWGVVPLIHQYLIFHEELQVRVALLYFLFMGLFYIIGAFFYISRIPERFMPGYFDIFFHSHQIFHIFIVLAAYSHFIAIQKLVEWRDVRGGCIPQGAMKTYGYNFTSFDDNVEYSQVSFDHIVDMVMNKVKTEIFYKQQ